MGQINSTIEEGIELEFNKVKKKDKKRDYLTVVEARKLKTPIEDLNINFSRIAVLYILDYDKNGKFSLEDLQQFSEFCCKISNNNPSLQNNYPAFAQEIEAQCTLCMWQQVCLEEGKKSFINWFVRLLSTNMKVKVKDYENVIFVNTDIVITLYELLLIKESYEIKPQSLISLMQSVGEELNLMKVNDEQLDNLVPLECISFFASNFVEGFLRVMTDLGFVKNVYSMSKNQIQNLNVTNFKANSESIDSEYSEDSEDSDLDSQIKKEKKKEVLKTPTLNISFVKKNGQEKESVEEGIKTPDITSPTSIQEKISPVNKMTMLKLGLSKLKVNESLDE